MHEDDTNSSHLQKIRCAISSSVVEQVQSLEVQLEEKMSDALRLDAPLWDSTSIDKFRAAVALRTSSSGRDWRTQSILELQDDRDLSLEAHHPLRALISNERKEYLEAEFTLDWCDPQKKGFGSFPPWCIVWMCKDPYKNGDKEPVMVLVNAKAISPDTKLV